MKNLLLSFRTMFRSRILTIGFILLIATIGIFVWRRTQNKPQTPTYQTEQVQKGTLIVSISSSGQISNANSGSISTQASGVVTAIQAHNGQYVKQGDPIVEIELDQQAKQNYSQALAAYQNAKNNVDTAQQNYYSLQADLFAKNKIFKDLASNSFYTNGDGSPNTTNRQLAEFIIAQDNWFAAEAKYKQQQSIVSQTQTSLHASWLALQETSPTIYAPISGTITGLALQVGSVLTTQTSTTGTITSQKVASIKTSAPPTVTINLSEIDVPKIKIGNKATITIDAFPDKNYTGEIVSIDTVGNTNSGVTTYPTTIKFDTEVPEIFSNMSAQANIITNSKSNVILVPSSAVVTENDTSYVRVLQQNQLELLPVEIGLASDTQTEIVSGIKEGDTVVTNTITQASGQRPQTSPFSAFGGGGSRSGGTFVGGGGNVRIIR